MLIIYLIASYNFTFREVEWHLGKSSRKLSFELTKLGMIPGGGGNAAVVGESAIPEDYG